MASLITELSDDDIRTVWPSRTAVMEADDDATDPGTTDDDATDADDDGTDADDDGTDADDDATDA
jgi:hypothetical protein